MLRRDSSRDKPLALLLQGKRRCPAGEILHGLLTASLPDGSDILDDEVELDYNRQVFIQKMIQ